MNSDRIPSMRIKFLAAEAALPSLLSASLATGLAMSLFIPSLIVAESLNKRFGIDDDWSMLALPAGVVAGLTAGCVFRASKRTAAVSIVFLVAIVAVAAWLSMPIRIPDSVPEGMNRLPYGIAQMLRLTLLITLLATAAVSFLLSFVIHVALAAVGRLRMCKNL